MNSERSFFYLAAFAFSLHVMAAACSLLSFPLWWDEGWNLLIAKNWAENGIYGEYLMGNPKPVELAGSVSLIAPVAIFFKYFGVGLWQSRIPALLFYLGTVLLVVAFVKKIFGKPQALLFLFLSLLLHGNPHLYAPMIGTQVLGELPMLLFVFLGYLAFVKSIEQVEESSWSFFGIFWALLAGVFFGQAVFIKLQIRPFILVAASAPILMSLFFYRLKALRSIFVKNALLCFFSAYLFLFLFDFLHVTFLPVPGGAEEIDVKRLYGFTALVVDKNVRMAGILGFFKYGKLVFASLVLSGILLFFVKWQKLEEKEFNRQLIRVSFWVLSASWLAWFLLFAASWARYAFPALFLGIVFASDIIYFCFDKISNRSALIAKVFIVGVLFLDLNSVRLVFDLWSRMLPLVQYEELAKTSAWLNEQGGKTANDQPVETYEAEILHLLNASYHHPGFEVYLKSGERRFLKKKIPFEYDFLKNNPKYIVVGDFARSSGLYRDSIERGEIQKIKQFGGYEVFERRF